MGALISTDVVADTAAAVAVKVELVKPVPIVIEAGMVTLPLEEVRATTVFDCAGLPRLKVHVLEPGVWMVAGEQTRLAVLAGVMVRDVERVADPTVAVMDALPEAFALAEALKVADDCPARIVAEAGTVTWALLLLRATVTLPDPAELPNDTVQVLVAPGAIAEGVQVTPASPAGG